MSIQTEVTKAEALRALADWVEAHPDIKVLLTASIYADNTLQAVAALSEAGPFDRRADEDSYHVFEHDFGVGLTLAVRLWKERFSVPVEKPATVYELPEELAAIAEGRS